MNTTSSTLRLTAAAAIVALAGTLAGCSAAENASMSDGAAAHVPNRAPVSAALHQALVRSAADRYVSELQVRHELATRSPHEAADRYLNDLRVHARMAAEGAAPGWSTGE
jgi:hypothetical protein